MKDQRTTRSIHKINVAVQVLPDGSKKESYERVDKCIALVAASGLKYRVCPFETVIEGYWDEILLLVKSMQEVCFIAGSEHIIINMKIQASRDEDVTIEDKTAKYD